MDEQLLQINFNYRRSDRKDLHELLTRIADGLPPEIGELDGYELATDFSHGRIFLYGPDASRILLTVSMHLADCDALEGVTAVLNPGTDQERPSATPPASAADKPGRPSAPKKVASVRTEKLLGLLIGIPREYGRLVLGQVAEVWGRNVFRIVIYDFDFEAAALPPIDPEALTPFFNQLTLYSTLAKWPAFSQACVPARVRTPPEHAGRGYIGLRMYNDVIVEGVVNAFYGLKPWRMLGGVEGGARRLLMPDARPR